MAKQAQCPVCGAELGTQIPDFCPACGWECGTDISLFPTLSKPTDVELEYRRRKLAQARERWIIPQGLEEIFVPGGNFLMGSDEEECYADEQPMHQVELSSFYIGKYPVMQIQWKEIMGFEPSLFTGASLPMGSVHSCDAMAFCNRLSVRKSLSPCYELYGEKDPKKWRKQDLYEVVCDFSAPGYRLPTEAEWEYAARGGKRSRGYNTNSMLTNHI